MQRLHVFAVIFASTVSACLPSELPLAENSQPSHTQSASLVVPPGPVNIPVLPSASSELSVSQILCDSYQMTSFGDDQNEDEDENDPAAQCTTTANSLYRELQVQLVSLVNPDTLNRGLASITESTTMLFPDGSYTQGADAFKDARPALFGANTVTGIENKFIYKPINKDTVIVLGDPSYTLDNAAAVSSVQYHVYTRQHQGEGSCRSLSKLSGKVCWSEVAGEWVYKQPFTGTSSPHGTSSVRSQIPTSADYPLTLESGRIACDGAFRARAGDAMNCEQAAREFYKEIEYQLQTLLDPSTVASGVATANEATTFEYPTGLVTESLMALAANTANLFGANSFPVGIENKFLYKPIDADTVLFIGDPMFTMFNFVTGQPRLVESVQLSVYRRNSTPLGNCRSATNMTGDVCWTELAEMWVYGQPVLGN